MYSKACSQILDDVKFSGMDDSFFQPKAISFIINRRTTTENLVQLNGGLKKEYELQVLVTSVPIEFQLGQDSCGYAWADVRGDHWDVAVHLRALQSMSRALPELNIKIDFEQSEESIFLSAGSFGDAQKEIENFLSRHPQTERPLLEGLFDSFEALVEGPAGDLESGIKYIEMELGRWEWPDGIPLTIERRANGILIHGQPQGHVKKIRYNLQVLQSAFHMTSESAVVVRMSLKGKQNWTATIRGFDQYCEIDSKLQAGARNQFH